VSGDTVKGWGFALIMLVVVALGFVGYRLLEGVVLKREVAMAIQEAQDLLQTVRDEGGLDSYREEYDLASDHLEKAKAVRAAGDLKEAFRSAERSRTLLLSVVSALRLRGPEGEALFVAVEGGVEFRRGERGPWQEARSRGMLNAGDYVKTSARGSAEIMTVDGALYTIRPNTIILVGEVRPAPGAGRQQTINLEFGWVDLGTSQSGSRVTTPDAEARVREETTAQISYDQEAKEGRFAAYGGAMVVATEAGASQKIGPLEQVVQSAGTLSQAKPLPAAPRLLGPEDDFETSLEKDSELVLSWQAVGDAASYALQVARTRFFVRNIIDVADRTEPRARLGLQGQGSFVWRVAVVDREGMRGPWSDPRRFRVWQDSQQRREFRSAEAEVTGAP
jgi:hypothetical protein